MLFAVAEPFTEPTPEPIKHTEATVLACLRKRYSGPRYGNGPRWAFATHVASTPGFRDGGRIADAVVMDLWPSTGLEIHGHEVKVSRSDWLTELKAPQKCEPVKRYCDRWWLVVSDRAIVKAGELPVGWGLMVVSGDTTRVVVKAPKLNPEPLTREFLAPLLRSTAKTERRQWVA